MRWIKASERLPKLEKVVVLKDNNGMYRMGNFYKDGNPNFHRLYIQKTSNYDAFEISSENFDIYFWLDEETEGWISVDDRMPEVGQFYNYSDNVLVWDGQFIRNSCWWPSLKGWNDDEDNITHWQPLPQPPRPPAPMKANQNKNR